MTKSTKQLIFVILILFVVNITGSKYYKRFDLTKDKRYTLSSISTTILSKLDKAIIINVYLEGDFPAEFKRLQIETQQFLTELKAKNSSIFYRFINPEDRRETLIRKGMIPSRLTVEENGKLSEAIIFPWAEIKYGKKTELVSLLPDTVLKTQEEQLQNAVEKLEYSFINGLHTITKNNKKKIAILSGNGELGDIYLYSFLSKIKNKYNLAKFTLDSVAKNPQKTLADLKKYDLAVIAKPKTRFSEEEKYVLDQYIVNGGNSLWMIDNNYADIDSLYNEGVMMAAPRDLNLTDLLFSYQIRINNKLVQDLYSAKIPLATGNTGNQTQFQYLNWFFNPLVNGNPNHPITSNIAPVKFEFTTQIDILKGDLQKTPLLVSSELTKKTGTPSIIELQSIANAPKQETYTNGPQLFSVLLEGTFSSAYENRTKPFSIVKEDSNKPAKMIIVADGDIAKNQLLKGEPYDLSKDKWTGETYGNKDFLENAVDYLLDDEGIIELRNKSIQINLLDKQRAFEDKKFWQLVNVIMPLIALVGFGISFRCYRKKKYSAFH